MGCPQIADDYSVILENPGNDTWLLGQVLNSEYTERMALSRRQVLQIGAGTALLPAAKAFAMGPAPKVLRFAYFSDTHVAVGRNVDENRAMLTEIAGLAPAFCINAGDVTDQGWKDQVDLYRKLVQDSGLKVHHCPGNHDVRWSPQGPLIFESSFGKPYRAFEQEGCWFILLDTTAPLSHWGNVATPQVEWLQRTLKIIGKEAPIFVFGHHWVGREVVQIDNELELIRHLRDYNVKLIGCAHGHSDLRWEVESRLALMNKGLYQLSYCIIDIDLAKQTFTVSRRTVEHGLRPIAKGELGPGAKTKAWRLKSELVSGLPAGSEYRLDGGPWMKTEGVQSVAYQTAGYHELDARQPDSPRIEQLMTETESSSVKRVWAKGLPGGVMSHVVGQGGHILVSTMDGSVLCFEKAAGREVWRRHLGGYCHSTPLATEKHVFVGSSDGHLYALDRKSGIVLWKRKLPGPVYAGPAMINEVVFITNHGAFFGLDAGSGEVRWQTPMPDGSTNFGQSVAATDGNSFIQGCWDSHLYCLEWESGKIRWRNPCQERTFAFSPAIGSPFISNGAVYVVANGNGLFKFDIATGKKLFEVASTGQKYGHSGPCVVGDRVFVGCLGDGEGEVRCASAADGKEIWMTKTGYTIYDSCARAGNGFVTINSVPGVVNVLKQGDGKLIGQFRLGSGHALSTSAVEGSRIYAASFANRLVCLEVKNP